MSQPNLIRLAEQFPNRPEVVRGMGLAVAQELTTQYELLCRHCMEANRLAMVHTLIYVSKLAFTISADDLSERTKDAARSLGKLPDNELKPMCKQLCHDVHELQLSLIQLLTID